MSESISLRKSALDIYLSMLPDDVKARAKTALGELCEASEREADARKIAFVALHQACDVAAEYRSRS